MGQVAFKLPLFQAVCYKRQDWFQSVCLRITNCLKQKHEVMFLQILNFLRGDFEQSLERDLLYCLPDVERFDGVDVAGAINCVYQGYILYVFEVLNHFVMVDALWNFKQLTQIDCVQFFPGYTSDVLFFKICGDRVFPARDYKGNN